MEYKAQLRRGPLRLPRHPEAGSRQAGAADAREWIDVPDFGGRYDAQMIDFARVVRGEIENPFGYDYELAVERTVLRACGISFGD